MKALSIKPPWAGLIMAGIKDVENRGWQTKERGLILIHVGKTDDQAAYQDPALVRYRGDVHRDLASVRGALLGVVELVGCHQVWRPRSDLTAAESHLAKPPSMWHEHGFWGWYLRGPVLFNPPIPYRGKLGLFNVPDEHLVNNEGDGLLHVAGAKAQPLTAAMIAETLGEVTGATIAEFLGGD